MCGMEKGIGNLFVIAKHRLSIDDRFEPRACLALIGLLGPVVQRFSAAATASNSRPHDEALGALTFLSANDCIHRRARTAGKIGEEFELGEIHLEFRPPHLGHAWV